jgi:hypothetical protein
MFAEYIFRRKLLSRLEIKKLNVCVTDSGDRLRLARNSGRENAGSAHSSDAG